MTTLAIDRSTPAAINVSVDAETLGIDLEDGRSIAVPTAWYPRLLYATQAERDNWRLIGKGHGIHWEEIDEDISVENILAGHPSGETQASFRKWLASRNR